MRAVFTPSGLERTFDPGTSLLDAARELGVDLDSVCGGRGICGRCQIEPMVGSFAKWGIESTAESLSPFGGTEAAYRDRRGLAAGRRLGCATEILGDVVVDVPAESQRHRQVVRKSLDLDGVIIDPRHRLVYLEIPKAELGVGESASELVLAALRSSTVTADDPALDDVAVSDDVLPALQPALARGEGAVTVAIRTADGGASATEARDGGRAEVTAIWPGFVADVFGLAIDIGSTTIAGHLCHLATGAVVASAGRMNPQIRFGEDLMSRVSYVMMNDGGEDALTRAVRVALQELTAELCSEAAVRPDQILDVVLVGNPIMHHLVLGIDPTPLGQAPFTLATAEPVHRRSRDLELDLRFATVYVGPCIAGHVGADTSAAILAYGPHRRDDTSLLIDVGTNAEIVLGSSAGLFAASSPTGPAFEGAQISCGQRATAGAIERVRVDRETLEPRLRVIGSDLWSDESGFEEATAKLSTGGVCGSGIIEAIGELFLAGVILADGTIDGSLMERSERIVEDGRTFAYVLWANGHTRLLITQADVRAIQLAKAALRAGIDLLLERAGIDTVSEIGLAGAFGSHIDPLYALVLGLVPDCPVDRVIGVGNAAGNGAARALLSRGQRSEMASTARRATKIETATEPRFQELFVDAMSFPHASAPSRWLGTVVDLPEPAPGQEGGRRASSATGQRSGRRRRRRTPSES